MRCPRCQSRPARRHCPALERSICTVCCGTKRRVEIRCPDTCVYLTNAQVHPPASVRRQQELDMAVIVPALSGLAEPAQQLLVLTLTMIDRARGDGLDAASDADVVDAVGSLARTYETSARGVIYEHRAGSVPAQRLAHHIKGAYDDVSRELPSSFASTAAAVLRRLEERVQEAHKAGLDPRHGFLDLVARVVAQVAPAAEVPEPGTASSSPLVLP